MQLIQNLQRQEVRLIQKQDHAQLMLAGQVLDVLTDGREQRGERGARLQSHADGELTIKVTAVDGRIVHVMDAVAALRKILFDGAKQTGLAATRIACHHSRSAPLQRGFQTLPSGLQGFGVQHLRGGNILAEGQTRQTVGR